MYFLERKEPIAKPNVLGNHSFPVYTYRWKAIYACPERWPLEAMLEKMDKKTHRIISNQSEDATHEQEGI